MTEVLVVGSINMDLVVNSPRMPIPGETLIGGPFRVVPGGKGANQAAAAAKLGCHVRMLAAVGQDNFGNIALDNLAQQGVLVNNISRNDTATGIAVIIVDDSGQNSIVVAPGANLTLESNEILNSQDIFQPNQVLITQCEIPLETTANAISLARRIGCRTILNAAPATTKLPDACYQVDYLVVNEHEAKSLTGIDVFDVDRALQAANELYKRGSSTVIVTLGALGCVFVQTNDSGHIPAPKVHAVDTTAAGDSFIGALAAALGNDMSIRDALCYANCAGALAATKMGAQTSLPDATSVETLYRQQHHIGGSF